MTEGYISDLFVDMALVTNVKIIRDRSTGFSPGYAFVELASQNAAVGVLEALAGEGITAKDGCCLRVSWSSLEVPMADAGAWDAGGQGRAPEGRGGGGGEGRGERRTRRERERGEGRGDVRDGRDSRADARARAEGGGGGPSEGSRRRRGGDSGAGGPDAEGQQRRPRGDGRANARADAPTDGRGEGGRGAGRAKPSRGPDESGGGAGGGTGAACCWAYVDPNDRVQVGFTHDEMRQWHELGYFDGDLQLALMPVNADRAHYVAPPPQRDFYRLREWFPDPTKSFTYIPRF